MAIGTTPPAEVALEASQVEALVSQQAPDLKGERIVALAQGWDNYLFRIGTEWLGRFPRREIAVSLIHNEARCLPELAARLPLPVPVPRLMGEPGEGYPWHWTIVPWIEGVPLASAPPLDPVRAAMDLGSFLRALHEPAPPDAPANPVRGGPLAEREEATNMRIAELGQWRPAARRLFDDALRAPEHHPPAVWLHGDLHPGNLIVADGVLAGVVDFGDITSGDPATDLSALWSVLGGRELTAFSTVYGDIDEPTRRRARGWALSLALAFHFSSADNPMMDEIARRTLEAVLAR